MNSIDKIKQKLDIMPAPTNLMEEQCQEILARMYRNCTLIELQKLEQWVATDKPNYLHK